ncbi:hypothetical protein PCO82_09245 [Pectobacteriaceae bacterium CE90]|nr:hypothetical protein PCO82_09245 [Pectobacteriaceae bacterium CE90]
MSAKNRNLLVKCTRCRNKHLESERVNKRDFKVRTFPTYDSTCPRCGGKNYYDLTPQFAWCWASGLIEVGDALPTDKADGSGAIQIAMGPKCTLKSWLEVVARHGKGVSAGKLLVPGVPEAPDGDSALTALQAWLKWCAPRTPKRSDITVVYGGGA